MANSTFSNASGGLWSVPGNWDTVPNSGVQVSFVSGTYTSQVDSSPWTIQSLNMNVATVTLQIDVDLTAQTLDGIFGSIVVQSGATSTLGSLNSSSAAITVGDNGVLTVRNLNGNNGTITAATAGLVNLQGNGAGNFTVAGGTLQIAGCHESRLPGARSRMLPSVRPVTQRWPAVACTEVRGPGPNHPKRVRSTMESPGFSDPVSPTVAPYSPSGSLYALRSRPTYAAASGDR